jgi:hypothetical protein
MTRSELEHLIRAASAIADDPEIVVIGSQSVLGQFPEAPVVLLTSMEADLFPSNHPERADLVDGAIGEGSSFHELFGYYAQGVSENTATLPGGWRARLVRVCSANTLGVTGLCLEVHDLAISKYVASRDKDLEFTRALARHGMTDTAELVGRLAQTSLAPALRKVVAAHIARDAGARTATTSSRAPRRERARRKR